MCHICAFLLISKNEFIGIGFIVRDSRGKFFGAGIRLNSGYFESCPCRVSCGIVFFHSRRKLATLELLLLQVIVRVLWIVFVCFFFTLIWIHSHTLYWHVKTRIPNLMINMNWIIPLEPKVFGSPSFVV